MKTGDKVTVRGTTLRGEVIRRAIDEQSDEVRLLVAYTDANGHTQQRWFWAGELEAAA